MTDTLQNLPISIGKVAYAGELVEVRLAIDDFIVLRQMGPSQDAKIFAGNLDQRINQLNLVKMGCSQEISTYELAFKTNPYETLKDICPSLNDISFSKAIQLFRMI